MKSTEKVFSEHPIDLTSEKTIKADTRRLIGVVSTLDEFYLSSSILNK